MNISFDRFAAMNMHYQRVSFSTFLDSIESLGLRSFELWAGSPHFYHPEVNRTALGRLKREVGSRGLDIVCLTPEQCLYPVNIAAKDADLRHESVDYFNSYIHQTAELDIRKILLTSGWGHYDENIEEAWKRCLDSVARILETCEKNGITIAFEILQEEESNIVHDFNSLSRMMSQFDSPLFTCCLDTVPVCVEGLNLEDYFIEFGSRISHIHLNDGTPTGHLTWGDGTQDLSAHLSALETYGYSGAMTLEIGDPRYYREPEKALEKGISYIKRFL